MLRHNLDVLHIEKNVVDDIIDTLLDVDGKTKDNYKARLDLQSMGIRHDLHPKITDAGKVHLLGVCYSMTREEKECFLKVIKNVKVPDGFASNISRCVKLQQHNIICLKSHDCHILMQHLMPIAIRRSLPSMVCSPLISLSCFFREICSKTLRLKDLDRLEAQISITLCQLERIFPPAFFTVMVYFVVHLVAECKMGRPVQLRWIYPIERMHKDRLKARNRSSRQTDYVIDKMHGDEFCDCFRDYAVEESLKSVNLFNGGVAVKQAGKYSGGMKRRLSVAISLIGDPKVVYMDEPSTGLDPASRNNLWNVVKRAKQDRAIILTTHSMEEAEVLCDRLAIFVDVSLQCMGNPKELKGRYGGSYVFTMTTSSDHEQDVEIMVRHLSPQANKIYHFSGTQKFELPKSEMLMCSKR